MEIFRIQATPDAIASVIESGPSQVMAIGDFDGVHAGHHKVLRAAVEEAERKALTPAVMTFHPHPREVLGHPQYRDSLTPIQDKLQLFEALGLQRVYLVGFDETFAQLPPEQFVEDILVAGKLAAVVVGFDFTFGHKGAGTPQRLMELARGRFGVEVVSPYHLNGEKVSSTLIRECLANGQVEKAARLLERPYSITGKVVTGEGRGSTIGMPTANVETAAGYVIPGRGVYAVQFLHDGQWHRGVMNIGWKPTFAKAEGAMTLETHLFDFNQNIYGAEVTIRFIGFIRHERKFGSAEELVAQITRDMILAKEMLS
ncbi:bifunctional riboflavin kinase/FAD synthetase [Paenibacillus sp. YN15]|uniref:bifunctional riboflavin kinase/FAD synthetase n=1 Tax=Paenibacillus sp. YN15 TaxID=1742774 RepID=UPI00215C8B52|nr:bifunctional riboflavin kinase/FAD synthetase [Paenibacillus sp. YN15]